MKHTAFGKAAGLVVAAATVLVVGFSVAPASASVANGVIGGAGWGSAVNDDWNDEGPLDSTSNRHSRATALWQLVLRAEGLYSGSIDCDYGPATTAATKNFQARFHLKVDGSAGPLTMGEAGQNFLFDDGNNRDITYLGTGGRRETFRRINGVYNAYINGAWRSATYTSASGCP